VLKGDECQCDRPKKSGHALCFRCYQALPRPMREDLWQPVGTGFESAYEAAVAYLEA
jgi:hypothetical protein